MKKKKKENTPYLKSPCLLSVQQSLRAKDSRRNESPMKRSRKGSSETGTPSKERDRAAYTIRGISKRILSAPLFSSLAPCHFLLLFFLSPRRLRLHFPAFRAWTVVRLVSLAANIAYINGQHKRTRRVHCTRSSLSHCKDVDLGQMNPFRKPKCIDVCFFSKAQLLNLNCDIP